MKNKEKNAGDECNGSAAWKALAGEPASPFSPYSQTPPKDLRP